jgi:hypothetical protein
LNDLDYGGVMKRLLLVFLMLLSGCAGTQNISTSHLRSPEYLRKTITVDKSIRQIQTSMYDYQYNVRYAPPLIINPANPFEALILYSIPGLSDSTTLMVIDLKEVGENKTLVEAYTYYAWDHHLIDSVLDACLWK